MKYLILPAVLALFTFTSCETKKEEAVSSSATSDSIVHNDTVSTENSSKEVVDWVGTYEGVLPCADCEGIKTIIELNKDNTFKMVSEYLGRENKFEEQGKFSWSAEGNNIALETKGAQKILFIVGDNVLIQLDQDGKKITGVTADQYIFHKK